MFQPRLNVPVLATAKKFYYSCFKKNVSFCILLTSLEMIREETQKVLGVPLAEHSTKLVKNPYPSESFSLNDVDFTGSQTFILGEEA